jgi:hypothetical protein
VVGRGATAITGASAKEGGAGLKGIADFGTSRQAGIRCNLPNGGPHMIGRLSILAASLIASFAAMARAQDHPVLLPTRDVAIIYRLPGDDMGKSAQKMQATFAEGSNKIRYDFFRFTEAKYPFSSWIFDRAAERLIVVMPESRQYETQPYPTGPTPGGLLSSDMGFKKQQLTAVAGQPCADWAVTSSNPKVNGTVACITDDGVLLRLTSPDAKDPPQLLAQNVHYATAPSQFFAPPPGFMRSKPPAE